jgi:large subunit ribosomal protein L22
MEFKVKSLYLKISPRKLRPLLHGLRGMTGEEAKNSLAFTNKKAAVFIHALIKSGIAAAKENYFDADKVTVKSIFCDEGPRLKRIQPWSKGQARRITKRMCHVSLILEGQEESKSEPKKKADTSLTKEKTEARSTDSETKKESKK